ncbi:MULTISPECIES: TOMM precursor leader peptide-binding protein [unclassified Streptomyces]|uniref:TOMM precursor leader peptide-binding protein n=1 Tax=unclassified Streptomyces TaxID=2593676 RepID=UPI0033E37596
MGTLGFSPHLRVERVPGEAVYLVSERGVTALHGRTVETLAPLLDGSRDLERILAEAAVRTGAAGVTEAADAAGAMDVTGATGTAGTTGVTGVTGVVDSAVRTAAAQVERVIARLCEAGLVCERGRHPRPEDAYWGLAGVTTAPAMAPLALPRRPCAAALRAAAVTPVALGCTGRDEAVQALRAAGIRALDEDGSCQIDKRQHGDEPLTLVVCDDYLDQRLSALDAEHRAAGRRWLPVKPVGTTAWIGPFLGGPDDPCWSCLADRLWRRRQAEAHVQRRLGRQGPVPLPPASLAASRAAALQLAALEAAGWLAGHRHPGQRALCTLDTLTSALEHHAVSRRPQCPACGDPRLVATRIRTPMPPPAAAPPEQFAEIPARRIMETYGHLISPVTGLVSEIRRDPRGPAFLNCFHARHPSYANVHAANATDAPGARSGPGAPPGLDVIRAGLHTAAHGKGMTTEQAQASALCEALEHYSGHFQGDEPRLRARYRDLDPEDAVHPDAVQLFDPRQFHDRGTSARHRVCDPFDEGAELDWTPMWSLTAQRHRMLPTALLYYGAPQPPGRRYCRADSNGAAAGGGLADAALRGFLELVERDAVALWWYNRTRQPALDLDACDDPWIAELRRVHGELRREVWALDLTSDLGIPVVAAVSRRHDKPAEDITLGFGAHFDRHTALRHALAELNQMLPPVVEARADGGGYGATADLEALRWFHTATLANQPYLAPSGAVAEGADISGPSPLPRDPLCHIAELVRGLGMELLVLDQTRPDVGLPVAKVLVPGLRPHWARFAPGRLFQAPVALGRLKEPTPYHDLNPVPLFL